MPKITTQKLNKYYVDKKSGTAVAALFDVDLLAPDGKFTVVVGSSGCGKTTLLKTLVGTLPADEGKIFFDDVDVTDQAASKRKVSLITQEFALYPHMTVFDNVAYPLKVARIPAEEIRRRVDETLAMLGVEMLSSRKIRQLSGGQQQRVALARAVVKEPAAVFLDEPLSNVDESVRKKVAQSLKDFQRSASLTFVYVTHNVDEARTLADHLVVMDNGTVVEQGDAKTIFAQRDSFFNRNFTSFSLPPKEELGEIL